MEENNPYILAPATLLAEADRSAALYETMALTGLLFAIDHPAAAPRPSQAIINPARHLLNFHDPWAIYGSQYSRECLIIELEIRNPSIFPLVT